ncbi:MAG TPA: NAD-dependent epimerase [Chloroflexus aurantiacus]|jgi:UDP-glucose 4-epimerase|uniref:NAD-dependent epimerase/dehydratase n=1 Tax=Chloroflexus aurantiacus (strain ATCC 29366 / DSM 635 / J-10-fl) TaxID=324602 RepID=A9WJZ6_CHLAA|nr:NAD-dependent epimerase/dehydratase family protein [Chloroflexus aurantiacus]ABY34447.1 NAD-dependent epimerase/dehydratase [Chloroflexus aurantiacus J-10-fl]RMG48766.1 MAG: NAD-dependent epimerase/dehydratase family protein [Chloroflexota bacterium]HBW68082.1 NAD-dependent epimerase [Chloroflexus aurantiacus]
MVNLQTFAGARVLITGGLGFIGSNLAHRLVELGANVTLVDSLIPEYGGNLYNIAGIEDRVRVNIADVRDEYSMNYLVQGQDVLFNLAGQTSHLDSMRNPYIDLDINCRAQLSILEACRKHNPGITVVYASTRQIYGKPNYLPVDERHLLHPVDVNGINKMAGEWYHILYNNVYGIRACALRLTNTYGPRMRVKDARQTFLGIWIRNVIEGKPIQVWGDGSQLRDFTYIDDCVDALLLAALHPAASGQIFNLGGLEVISLRDLAALTVEVAGGGSFEIIPYPADRKPIDIGDYYADDRRIRTMLGWQPRIDLRTGLARTIAFYREHRHHYWDVQVEGV